MSCILTKEQADVLPGTLVPTGGPQGIFELDKNHKVVPYADPKIDLLFAHMGRQEQEFLNEARNERNRAKD